MNALMAAGLPFTAADEGRCLSFRVAGKPMVDFFPHTGRWRRLKPKWVGTGGAAKFLEWYRSQ